MKIEVEGTPEDIERFVEFMEDALVECSRGAFGQPCGREEEHYCQERCPFNVDRSQVND